MAGLRCVRHGANHEDVSALSGVRARGRPRTGPIRADQGRAPRPAVAHRAARDRRARSRRAERRRRGAPSRIIPPRAGTHAGARVGSTEGHHPRTEAAGRHARRAGHPRRPSRLVGTGGAAGRAPRARTEPDRQHDRSRTPNAGAAESGAGARHSAPVRSGAGHDSGAEAYGGGARTRGHARRRHRVRGPAAAGRYGSTAGRTRSACSAAGCRSTATAAAPRARACCSRGARAASADRYRAPGGGIAGDTCARGDASCRSGCARGAACATGGGTACEIGGARDACRTGCAAGPPRHAGGSDLARADADRGDSCRRSPGSLDDAGVAVHCRRIGRARLWRPAVAAAHQAPTTAGGPAGPVGFAARLRAPDRRGPPASRARRRTDRDAGSRDAHRFRAPARHRRTGRQIPGGQP